MRARISAIVTATAIALPLQLRAQDRQSAVEPSGAAVYATHCASCHDQVGARIPTRDSLAQMSPARILRTLDFGLMMSIAYPLQRGEREAVAAFVGKGRDDTAPPASALCGPEMRIMSRRSAAGWAGWAPSQDNTRYQPAEHARLRAADVARLELKWAYGFAGDIIAFAAPTVVDGTLFIGSAGGAVQALDAKTGCVHWMFQATGPVRAAMTVATVDDERRLLFSDQNGGVYGVDATTGALRWQTRVEQHEATRLTGSFAVHDGIAFVPAASWEETRALDPEYPCCTFRGSVTAVRVRDGSVVWQTYFVDEPQRTGQTAAGTPTFGPSGAGVWSTPTVDERRGLLYVTTGDNYSFPATATSDAVVALELATGRIVWSQQTTPNDVYNSSCGSRGANCPEDAGPDHDFGSSAMLVRTANGADILVAGQKSGVVYAFDPANGGKPLWQARVGKGGTNGGVQWGMASDGRNVYAAVSDVVRLQNVARCSAGRLRAARPQPRRRAHGARRRDRRARLVRAEHAVLAAALGLQPRAAGRRHGHSRRRVLGLPRRPSARVRDRRRKAALGLRHGARLRNGQRRRRQRRLARRRRRRHRRRHGVRELRLPAVRRDAGQCLVGVRRRRLTQAKI